MELLEKKLYEAQLNHDIQRVYDLKAYNASSSPVSLDEPIGEDKETPLLDMIPDDNQTEFFEIDNNMLHKDLMALIDDTFTKPNEQRTKEVLIKRFGLNDGYPRTLGEIGKDYNVTRERIRQIEAKGLRKLRNPQRSKKLKDYNY